MILEGSYSLWNIHKKVCALMNYIHCRRVCLSGVSLFVCYTVCQNVYLCICYVNTKYTMLEDVSLYPVYYLDKWEMGNWEVENLRRLRSRRCAGSTSSATLRGRRTWCSGRTRFRGKLNMSEKKNKWENEQMNNCSDETGSGKSWERMGQTGKNDQND